MITNNRAKMPIDDNTMLSNPSCNMNAKNKIPKPASAKRNNNPNWTSFIFNSGCNKITTSLITNHLESSIFILSIFILSIFPFIYI